MLFDLFHLKLSRSTCQDSQYITWKLKAITGEPTSRNICWNAFYWQTLTRWAGEALNAKYSTLPATFLWLLQMWASVCTVCVCVCVDTLAAGYFAGRGTRSRLMCGPSVNMSTVPRARPVEACAHQRHAAERANIVYYLGVAHTFSFVRDIHHVEKYRRFRTYRKWLVGAFWGSACERKCRRNGLEIICLSRATFACLF